MRLAFVSPLPPAATGIADYAADVLERLAAHHTIDAFHDQAQVDTTRLPRGVAAAPVHELLARHAERPYDVAIHQLGNAPAHAFVWDALARLPGLLVLHDLVLHHARGRMFLDAPAVRAYAANPWNAALREAALRPLSAYEAELAYAYPRQARRLAAVQLGSVGALLPYAYPLFRLPVEASRVTAVHNRFMAAAIRDEIPNAEVATVQMRAEAAVVAAAETAALRARHALADAFVVGCYGLLTPEKQIATVARAVARAAVFMPRFRLLLVGPVPDRAALDRLLARLGVQERSVVTGRVPFQELPAHIEAADVVVHLRYPSARETSAALLRVLAQGRPTVMTDLENLAEVPDDAVVRADPADEEGDVTRALLRLAERPALREQLGRRAAEFVRREHSGARCLESYEAALERAASRPPPPTRDWPAHWPRPEPPPSPSQPSS
jgi:glycosyltransferase involved in cell wall biosynthesis